MTVQASVTISGTVSGLSTGSKTIGPIIVPVPGSPTDATSGQITTLQLASGDNTILIPSTSTQVAIIVFSSQSATTKKLKGVGGDTGIVLDSNGANLLTFVGGGSSPASFVINSSAADTGFTTEITFI